jgi:uncharacterized membrane protein
MGYVGLPESAVLGVLALPLLLRWIPPNRFYGMRTATTLSRRDIWYSANAFAGAALLIASLVSMIVFTLVPGRWLATAWTANSVLLVPLATAVIASYVHLRRY